MIKTSSLIAFAWIVLLATLTSTFAAPPPPPAKTVDPDSCRPLDLRSFLSSTITLPATFEESYRQFSNGKLTPLRGFADALTLRRMTSHPDVKLFSEYWMARALYRAGLVHVAHAGFEVLLRRPATQAQAPILEAALSCMLDIRGHLPTLGIHTDIIENSATWTRPAGKDLLAEAGLAFLMDHIADADLSAITPIGFKLIEKSGGYEALGRGLVAARLQKHRDAIRHLKQFLFNISIQPKLRRHIDAARIILARSFYSTRQYSLATEQLRLLPKQSPQINEILTELSWAYLQDEKYRESIGTALNLQTGLLAQTYAPEAPMVLAMALNEFCQFPAAVQAIQYYRKRYRQTYFWLRQWEQMSPKPSLYQLATEYHRENSKVPARIAAEWIKIRGFLGRQAEINALFDERQNIQTLSTAAALEQRNWGDQVLKKLTKLQKDALLAKIKLKPGELLPSRIQTEAEDAMQTARIYRRYRFAAPLWQAVLSGHFSKEAPRRSMLVKLINSDLERLNRRMISQLSEIAENTQLIEIEIYNGASQDIIWKQAHPDYEQVAQDLRAEDAGTRASAIWSWGRVHQDLNDEGEYWEDELGTFRADLYDNCASKDRYLQVKRRLASE